MYSIVDIETTGGSASKNRITEIAIYVHDGKKIVSDFHSLINPNCNVPSYITRLTGIDNKMLADAPQFHEIVDKIEEFTRNSVFVAHNVNFDYSFLREEYKRCGLKFQRKKLCTVRLSRKIFPGKPSYSLGRLCSQLEIPVKNRHRAAGDAEATCILFSKLLKNDKDDFIKKSLNQKSLEALMPPNLSKEQFLGLPEKMGIYYFLDRNKKIIYIGKANNIKKRAHTHFSGNTNTKSKFYFIENIHYIEYKVCGNELVALLEEATEIKKHWPRYNRSLKKFTLNYALYNYEDRNNYIRFSMGRCGKNDHPLITFRSGHELRTYVEKLCMDFKLCPKLCGLQTPGNRSCFSHPENFCEGACTGQENYADYNEKCKKALDEIKGLNKTFLIKGESGSNNKMSVVLMEKGRYKGYGDAPINLDFSNLENCKMYIQTGYDDQDMQNLVHSFLRNSKNEDIVYFS